jgi:acyl-coenzyme A synthetase/AMP-(fatty) acid ligase
MRHSASTSPLVTRDGRSPLALVHRNVLEQLTRQLAGFEAVGSSHLSVTTEQFVSQVIQLAQQLPAHAHMLNLCRNRYLFMLSFCAGIVRGQCNLLPQNKGIATQQDLVARYPDSYILHDGLDALASDKSFNLLSAGLNLAPHAGEKTPDIPLPQAAALAFTSGTTGQSKPNLKTWHTIAASSQINRQYFLPAQQQSLYCLLATVPGQHMWGLETSVLLPLFAEVCVLDSQPLFPADICAQLAWLPAPRVMVSTPVHLSALVKSSLSFPTVQRLLCATAPLATALASRVELTFAGELCEIYGCSEVGSMAARFTARDQHWNGFEGLNFYPDAQGVSVKAAHLPGAEVRLPDQLHFSSERQFTLAGRDTDMLEVAGKRGSLAELNALLQLMPGVIDGVVLLPDNTADTAPITRPMALVVLAEGTSKADLADFFRQHVDPVFIPRPICQISKLPREENGKLARQRLLAEIARLKDGEG